MKNIFNYIRYTNVTAILFLNPFSWKYFPTISTTSSREWYSPKFQLTLSWLFVKVAICIDDGSW